MKEDRSEIIEHLEHKHTDESAVKRFFDTFGDLVCINLLFFLTSIPVFTIGASLTALNDMCIKWQTNRSEPLVKGYFTSFRKNFRNSTIVWSVQILYLALLVGEYILICKSTGTLAKVCVIILVFEAILGLLSFSWAYLILAVYDTTPKDCIKNSVLLSLSHPGQWLFLVLLWLVPIVGSILYTIILYLTWWVWPILMVALLVYISSSLGRNIFLEIEKRNLPQ